MDAAGRAKPVSRFAGLQVGDITHQLANARLEPEAILTAVMGDLSRARAGTWVASLINKDPRTTLVVAANDAEPQLARYVEDLHRSGEAAASTIATQVIETGRPVLLPSVSVDEFVSTLRTDMRSYLAKKAPPVAEPVQRLGVLVVPMRARGATVGTLGIFESSSAIPLNERDVEWLQGMADSVGLAAENAQLYADAVRRLGRLAALRNIGLALSGSSDLRLTLQVVLDQVTAGLGADAADVLLLEEDGTVLLMAARTGFQTTSVPEYRLPVDGHLPGRVIANPRVETVIDASALAQFRRRTLFAREGFRAYCVAPLVARGRATGVLELFQRSALQPDDEWLGFLESVSGYAAMAIDSSALYERLRSEPAKVARTGAGAPRLSAAERQILAMVVEGSTNGVIAESVHLSQSTVKFHVRQILQKAGAANRTELARMATRDGWL